MDMQAQRVGGARPRILVVDEGAGGLDGAVAILSRDFEVTSVSDGARAMALLAKEGFDVLCADQAARGLDLLGRAAHLPLAPTGVLLADPDDFQDELAFASPIQILFKPFEPQLLLDTVQRASAISRMKRR